MKTAHVGLAAQADERMHGCYYGVQRACVVCYMHVL